jgi:hypothetical protein
MLSERYRTALVKLAADLVCGRLLPELDTEHWFVSTPQSERRRIVKAMEDVHERHKVLAMELKKLTESSREQHSGEQT